ncbi:MAG: ABC transporter ATP-binding protein, partial [Dehalococcoidia bacterium]
AVHSDPDILLIDEVLAVGDANFQDKCLAKMYEFQTKGVTIVVVAHALDVVQKFCQRAILLDSGHIVTDGAPDVVVAQYTGLLTATAGSTPEMAL